MLKSKRLMELMMYVNRKRRFKVQELADAFGGLEAYDFEGFAGAERAGGTAFFRRLGRMGATRS